MQFLREARISTMLKLNQQQRADLLAFIHDEGKGFVASHTATNAFMSWPEFGELLGGRYDDHPWNTVEAPVINEDPNFPASKHLPGVFNLTDEFYQTSDFSREAPVAIGRRPTTQKQHEQTERDAGANQQALLLHDVCQQRLLGPLARREAI